MTGYGKVVVAFKDKKISAEIKSLNSKQLDLQTRIAPLYREKEMEIRQMIAASLERGKVDFSLWIEKEAGVDATPVNAALVENYYHQLKDVATKVGIPEPEDWMYTLTRMPDVLSKTEQEELTDEEWAAARKAVEGAMPLLPWWISVSRRVLRSRRSLLRRLIISSVCWQKSNLSRRVV